MARNLITLAQASDHLRRDTDADDADLQFKIAAASEMVLAYLGEAGAAEYLDSDDQVPVDGDGNPEGVPAQLTMSTKYLVGLLYADRDGAMMDKWKAGELPAPVMCMLTPLRGAVVA